jgi:hypothetical protein
LLSGALFSLCLVFKHGKRDDVIGLAPKILSQLSESPHATSTNTNLRKLYVKVTKWVGVTFLPPRVAKWRYQRGGRSLEEALAVASSAVSAQQVCVHMSVPMWYLWHGDVCVCVCRRRGEGRRGKERRMRYLRN